MPKTPQVEEPKGPMEIVPHEPVMRYQVKGYPLNSMDAFIAYCNGTEIYSLPTNNKTIVGAINELKALIDNIDLSDYATKEELEPKVKEEVTASIQPLEEEPAPSAGDSFEAFVATAFDNNKDEAQTIDITEAATQVKNYVERIIYEMDLEASIETTTKRRQINLQIETPEPGRIIGYHGKVLKSLQLLAQNYLYDHYSKAFSVSVNVHDYVEHRTETLIDFSQKIASRVLASGQDFRMDPMSNSERKIVHKAISHIDGVDSYSEGSDPNRYVVVTVKNW